MPRPCVKLPCGSKSIRITLLPRSDSPIPILIVVVVLPTPPFWFAIAITRAMTAASWQYASAPASRPLGPRDPIVYRNRSLLSHPPISGLKARLLTEKGYLPIMHINDVPCPPGKLPGFRVKGDKYDPI